MKNTSTVILYERKVSKASVHLCGLSKVILISEVKSRDISSSAYNLKSSTEMII